MVGAAHRRRPQPDSLPSMGTSRSGREWPGRWSVCPRPWSPTTKPRRTARSRRKRPQTRRRPRCSPRWVTPTRRPTAADSIRYSLVSPSRLDGKALEAAHPDIAAKFTKAQQLPPPHREGREGSEVSHDDRINPDRPRQRSRKRDPGREAARSRCADCSPGPSSRSCSSSRAVP